MVILLKRPLKIQAVSFRFSLKLAHFGINRCKELVMTMGDPALSIRKLIKLFMPLFPQVNLTSTCLIWVEGAHGASCVMICSILGRKYHKGTYMSTFFVAVNGPFQ